MLSLLHLGEFRILSQSSATISAGQSAKFNLTITPTPGFSATVNRELHYQPDGGPGADLLAAQHSSDKRGAAAQVQVTVATTAAVTTGAVLWIAPRGTGTFAWIVILGLGDCMGVETS